MAKMIWLDVANFTTQGKRIPSSHKVIINADQIQYVEPHEDFGSRMYFGEEDWIVVDNPIEEIYTLMED